MTPGPRVSVVVRAGATPEPLITCLEHLGALRTAPHEIIVVDSGADESARLLVAEKFPDVVHLPAHRGPGRQPTPWQAGLTRASGDVVAFLDDDTRVVELWLDALTAPYADPTVAGVGGRVATGARCETEEGLASIGRILPSGELTHFFGADPGRAVDVDHLPEANMSFRMASLASVGGFRGSLGGPGSPAHQEGTDAALRLGAAGHRLVFAPQAVTRRDAVTCAEGVGAHRLGALRHLFGMRRDHLVLLVGAYGWAHPLVRRYPVTTVRDQHRHLRAAYRLLRGRPNDHGTRPPITRRLIWPVIFVRSVAELTGLLAGVPAAAQARRPARRPARSPDAAETGHGA